MDIHLQAVSRETGGTRTTPPPFEVSLSSICLAQCFVSYETRSPGDCPSIQPLQSPFFWEKKRKVWETMKLAIWFLFYLALFYGASMTWTQRNPLPCVVPFLKKKANLNSPDARVFSPCFCLLKLYPSLSSSRQAAMAMVGQREEGEKEQVRSSVPSSASWLDLIATWWGKHFLLPQGRRRRSRWRRLSSIISLVCPSAWPCSSLVLIFVISSSLWLITSTDIFTVPRYMSQNTSSAEDFLPGTPLFLGFLLFKKISAKFSVSIKT